MRHWRCTGVAFALAMMALGGGGVCAQAPSQAPVVTFRAPMENVREARQLMEQGFESGDTVEVSERAVVFEPPLVIADARNPGNLPSEEVRFLVNYLQANFNGTPEALAEFWDPSARTDRLKQMRSPERLRASREYFAKMPGVTVLAVIYQQGTASVITSRGMGTQTVHLRRTADRLYLTDRPANDLSIAIVEASLAVGTRQ